MSSKKIMLCVVILTTYTNAAAHTTPVPDSLFSSENRNETRADLLDQADSLDITFPEECSLCLLKTDFALGASFIAEKLPEGAYNPVLVIARMHYTFGPQATLDGLSMFAEPQLNPVQLNEQMQEYEFGLNIGLQFTKKLSRGFSLYAGIGSGPHFVSVKTRRQAGGFIFSDNFLLGIRAQFAGFSAIDIQYRFRHISNASLRAPNNGIDNHFVVVGYTI